MAKMLEQVESGECQYGVVPIENTESGAFKNVYDCLNKYKVYINGEIMKEMDHCLVAVKGTKEKDIVKVYSHPHVFEECDRFLSKLEQENQCTLERVALADTAGACALLSRKNDSTFAAIASARAAELNKLEILKTPVANDRNILTRYVVLSKNASFEPGTSSAKLKRSLAITLRHEEGSMFKMMSCFAFRNIFIHKFESRPSSKALSMFNEEGSKHWEYVHFIDFEPSPEAATNEALMKNLEEYCIRVRDFGVYQTHRSQKVQKEYELLFM